jgi:DNA-binding MarR family transcriptional regulator
VYGESTSLESLFKTFDRMNHSCMKAELDRRGLQQVSHPMLLFILKKEFGSTVPRQADLAKRIGVAPSTIAISVRRMEKAGLLEKLPDETDMRKNRVALTKRGQELITECESAFRDIHAAVFDGFSDEEREVLKSFYLRMIKNLEKMGVKAPCPLNKEKSKL